MASMKRVAIAIFFGRGLEILVLLTIVAVLCVIVFLDYQKGDYVGHLTGPIKAKLRMMGHL